MRRPGLAGILGLGALMAIALGAGSESHATWGPSKLQFSIGATSKGVMTLPLYRGGSLPDEFLLLPTPGNCERSVQVTYLWDEDKDLVRMRLKGKGVLEPYPEVDRTEGVDFFPNPFWPETMDFENGRYQFWTISTPDVATFYYDGQSLQLLGSEYDFATPPPNSIPVQVPVFAAIPTPFFQPEPNGDLDLVVEYEYDRLVRPDRPDLAHTIGTFLPHSLCTANPFRYDLSSTRPWAKTLPASHAKSFREFLENGLIFDMTVEPPTPATDPPLTTMAGVYQGAVAVAGAVPKGWTVDLEALFGGTAPPIIPLPSAPFAGEACVPWFKPKRDRSFNVCTGGPQP